MKNEIPKYHEIMLPLLELVSNRKVHTLQELESSLARHFELSEDQQRELLPSGSQPKFYNRLGWARTYLKKAGLVEQPERGQVRITDRGLAVLKENPSAINSKYLRKFEDFLDWKRRSKIDEEEPDKDSEERTPEESLEENYQALRENLCDELLLRIKSSSPRFFEILVIDLLVSMGYGGSRKDAGQAVGRRGDGGIDGLIKEDKLGLDVIYVQAKRWEHTVGQPVIREFAGSLDGVRAKRGIVITTSAFSNDAREYVGKIDKKIVLIDGRELADLMVEHGIGVSSVVTYDIKKMDNDYFTED